MHGWILWYDLLEQDIYNHLTFSALCCFIPGVLSYLRLFNDREDRRREKSLESSSTVACLSCFGLESWQGLLYTDPAFHPNTIK